MVVCSSPGVGTSLRAVPSSALVRWLVVVDDLALLLPSSLPGACCILDSGLPYSAANPFARLLPLRPRPGRCAANSSDFSSFYKCLVFPAHLPLRPLPPPSHRLCRDGISPFPFPSSHSPPLPFVYPWVCGRFGGPPPLTLCMLISWDWRLGLASRVRRVRVPGPGRPPPKGVLIIAPRWPHPRCVEWSA